MERLIDADELIKDIKEQYNPHDNNPIVCEIVGDIIHNLIENAFIVDLNLVNRCGWIPCEYRIPEEKPESQTKIDLVAMGVRDIKLFNFSEEVLVTVRDITEDELFVATDSTENGKWRERFHKEYEHSYEVLAWRPMPIQYKEKERD